MVIRVRPFACIGTKCFATVNGLVQGDTQYIKNLFVAWVNANLTEIKWAWVETVDSLPVFAPIG